MHMYVCLNLSDNHTSVQLHFALFNGSAGFVLKPTEMQAPSSGNQIRRGSIVPSTRESVSTPCIRSAAAFVASTMASTRSDRPSTSDRSTDDQEASEINDAYWPPPRERLYRTTIKMLSLHTPKV
jgi:hypothetical protein